MLAEMEQIKTSYESEGMTPEQIAEDRGLDLIGVKAALMQCSSLYRRDCGKEDEVVDELNFSNEQLAQANQVIYELAVSSDDENLRFKAASYIRDDKRGRKDIVKGIQGTTFNILQFNEALSGARERAKSAKNRVISSFSQNKQQKAINV